ncbi:hypothetical protein IJI72_02340 [Candidatus Saccharibacteria bacterium]|nr:hypothetical protein [Candidatus Saccharibacteria bacterium]
MDKTVSKKKTLAIASILGIGALLLSSRSLAYFTDKDNLSGVFTFGDVDIALSQQQRQVVNGEKTTTLENFQQNQALYPVAGELGYTDSTWISTATNYADKIVTVKNTESTAAWIRAYVAVPATLDQGYTAFNGTGSALHLDYGKTKNGTTAGKNWDWGTAETLHHFNTTINGTDYHVYYADYMTTLAGGATSERLIQGLYLDSSVSVADSGTLTLNGNELTGITTSSSIDCPVFVVAVQANGFTDAKTAVEAAFGQKYNPWGGSVSNWQ